MPVELSSLTSKQKKVYYAIESFIKLKGIPPTVREIGEMVGDRTPGAVQGILNRLEQKGVIRREVGAARSIQLVSNDSQYLKAVYIPEIKRITRRNVQDLLNIYNINCYHPVSPYITDSSDDCFIINYYNENANGLDLNDETMLIISTAFELKPKDIVLALYENHVLLRQYQPNDNPDMLTLKTDSALIDREVFNKSDITIVGKLIGRFIKY